VGDRRNTAGVRDRRSPVPRQVRARESVRRLKQAMADDRLALRYQPIFRAADRRPVAAEALLRWRRPEQEEDDLGALLAAAERSPVIFALETWGMQACFRDAAAWQSGPLPGLRVNLNLSAREFRRKDLLPRVVRALEAQALDPRQVTLEITESSAIHSPDETARTIERLAGLGLQLWLDDFGTGHSSLAWLSWFPIDGLKIPGLFVSRITSDERCSAIVTAVLQMARRLGLRVAAEGIEHEAQLARLVEQGCDELQGFLLAEPLAAGELARRLGPPAAQARSSAR
jgi:EAL domain-containing protein (putative c-di-GMP-specific phosphodiesterase class I)